MKTYGRDFTPITNAERGERAYRVALIYGQRYDNEDIEAAIIDLTSDLLHLAGDYGYDAAELQRIALDHYTAEIAGEA